MLVTLLLFGSSACPTWPEAWGNRSAIQESHQRPWRELKRAIEAPARTRSIRASRRTRGRAAGSEEPSGRRQGEPLPRPRASVS